MTVVVIGAGHNGLSAAFYLARAGLKPIVVEQSATVGGGAITGELHPGFTCPTLTHHASIRSDIAGEMDLSKHGLEVLRPAVDVFIPALDGASAVMYADTDRTAAQLRASGARDAEAFLRYRAATSAIGGVLEALLTVPPPHVDEPDARDLWNLLTAGRRFRSLGKQDGYRLLRWAPMPVADFATEWFESPLLRAAICGSGVSGTMLGPRSAGSTLVHLLRQTNRRIAGGHGHIRGGPGALTRAMAAAATGAGADIRVGHRVDRIAVANGAVTAVAIDGQDIAADAVVSAIDPKTTFLKLLDPLDLSPDFLAKMGNFRAAGTVAKVNLALSALPSFGATSAELLSGSIHIGEDVDVIERAFDHAKYGELSEHPWLDVTIPSVLDPSLVPPGAHVMSIYVHYAPFRLRGADWDSMSEAVLTRTLATLERVAPGIKALVVAAQVITPQELESTYGFGGGHIFHGELAIDQLFTMRPLLGYSGYRTPIRGLYLCGAGTHPGGFMSGSSGKLAANTLLASVKR
jgi:phytoene dehydrogenase-like protein